MDILYVAIAALALFGAVASIAGFESRDGFDDRDSSPRADRTHREGRTARMLGYLGLVALDVANEKAREAEAQAERWRLSRLVHPRRSPARASGAAPRRLPCGGSATRRTP